MYTAINIYNKTKEIKASCSHFKLSILGCLTHWGRVTHIYISNLSIIGSDNDLSPGRRQAITWTNDRILETIFSEILIEIDTFSFKILCGKWRP